MEVVLAGASGLLGTALRESLRGDGHRVKQLVRHPVSEPDMDRWDPAQGLLDPGFVQGADAIVCFSGVGVAGRRWNDEYKRTIWSSRIDSVGTVARTLEKYGGPPVFIAASAVGYYGDTGDRETDESGPPGDTFLAGLCVEWEAAAEPARAAGVRVAQLRTGHVLAKQGDLMKKLIPIVKAGIGGRLGNGRQYMPWITLVDHVAAVRFLLEHDVSGPVNIVGPHPVTNAEFMKTLGHVLHRPTLLPAPRFGARLVGGELADEAFIGQRAVPRKLLDAGFGFTHDTLQEALRAELG